MDTHKRVPLVIYGPDGERKVVGEAEVHGEEVLSHVTDPEVWEQLTGTMFDHLSIGEDDSPKGSDAMNFKTFLRRPFTVEAVEVTDENFEEIASMTGEIETKDDGSGVTFISTNRKIVPNVFRIYRGFWLTRMGDNLRAYSSKTFNEMFQTP